MQHRAGPRSTPWTLLDPGLATPAACKLPNHLLAIANEGWPKSPATQIEVDDPASEDFLARHRVSTILRPGEVGERSRTKHVERLLRINGVQLRIEATAREVLSILSAERIETVLLKGLASADLDYPDPSLRQTGDVDIAVRMGDFDDMVGALRRAGYRGKGNVNSPQLLKGITLLSPHGIEVDIHTRLFQRSPFCDLLFVETEPLRGLPGQALAPSLRMLHAAGHFILAPPGTRRLSGLLDIARLHQNPRVDLGEVRDHARTLAVEPLVGAALCLEAQLSNRGDVLDSLQSWQQPGWLDRNTRLVSRRRLTLDHVGRFREVLPNDRLDYLRVWMLPNKRQRRLFKTHLQSRIRAMGSKAHR